MENEEYENFKKEQRLAFDKMQKETSKIEDEYIFHGGRDDTVSYLCKPIIQNYNNQLKQLKQKYNIL